MQTWSGALSNTKLSNLQRYQDRALELIESSKIKDAYNKSILNVNQLLTFDRAVMTLKIVNQLCPEGLQNKCIERSALSKYNTRNMKDIHVQKLELEHRKKVFCTLVQKPGIVSHSSSETPNPLYDSKKI